MCGPSGIVCRRAVLPSCHAAATTAAATALPLPLAAAPRPQAAAMSQLHQLEVLQVLLGQGCQLTAMGRVREPQQTVYRLQHHLQQVQQQQLAGLRGCSRCCGSRGCKQRCWWWGGTQQRWRHCGEWTHTSQMLCHICHMGHMGVKHGCGTVWWLLYAFRS